MDGWEKACKELWAFPVYHERAARVFLRSAQIYGDAVLQLDRYLAGEISAEEMLLCGQDKQAYNAIKSGLTTREESGIVLP
jgi:hypothetical protein